jgi:predicted ATPase
LQGFIINQKLTIVVITVKITRQITQIISQNMWLIIQCANGSGKSNFISVFNLHCSKNSLE